MEVADIFARNRYTLLEIPTSFQPLIPGVWIHNCACCSEQRPCQWGMNKNRHAYIKFGHAGSLQLWENTIVKWQPFKKDTLYIFQSRPGLTFFVFSSDNRNRNQCVWGSVGARCVNVESIANVTVIFPHPPSNRSQEEGESWSAPLGSDWGSVGWMRKETAEGILGILTDTLHVMSFFLILLDSSQSNGCDTH